MQIFNKKAFESLFPLCVSKDREFDNYIMVLWKETSLICRPIQARGRRTAAALVKWLRMNKYPYREPLNSANVCLRTVLYPFRGSQNRFACN